MPSRPERILPFSRQEGANAQGTGGGRETSSGVRGRLHPAIAGAVRARQHRTGLAGEYAGPTAQGTVGVGAGANVLIGGSSNQFTLQPVSVEGSVGLNAAAGVAAVSLRKVP
jgi:Protein of unknown function (DUF992)